MSRLDSVIRRLIAQRDIFNDIARNADLPGDGPVLEFGLGNGRTYHHLRELFPERRIVAFDRAVLAHRDSIPADDDMVLGEIKETGQAFIGTNAVLAHADIGTGYYDMDGDTRAWLAPLMAGVLAPGGIAVSGLVLDHPELKALPLPEGIAPGRYFLYERA